MSSTTCRAELIKSTSEALSKAFVGGSVPPNEMLDKYFTASPRITEHGPSWATSRLPFLSKTFAGRRSADLKPEAPTCDDYFDELGKTLSLQAHEKTLPESANGYVVDPNAVFRDGTAPGVVMVRSHAQLKSLATEKTWGEDFVFVYSDFGEDGKIGRMEIWADSLSAWAAVEN